jgi:hypothetical protein
MGLYSSVSIDSLLAGRSEDRMLVGARYFAFVQIGPRAHSASYTMRTESFTGSKQPGRGVDHPSPSNPDVKEKVELCIYSLYGASLPVLKRNFAYLQPG